MLWLFVLSILATLAFALAALPFFLNSEPSTSGGLSNVLDRPVVNIIIAIVVLGPLVEEIMFRGWLNGTWQSLIGTALFVLMFYNGPTFAKGFIDVPLLTLQLGFSAIGIAVMFALGSSQQGTPIIGFERVFPLIFWGQGIVFGALHFRNIYSDALALPLLMTFTLVICGWLWGYARVVLGLPAAVLLHMAYNVPSAVGMLAFVAMAS